MPGLLPGHKSGAGEGGIEDTPERSAPQQSARNASESYICTALLNPRDSLSGT